MTATLPPLPPADGVAETNKEWAKTGDGFPVLEYDEVGAWSEPLVRAYGAACAAAEREAIAKLVQGKPIILDGREARRGPGSVGTWYKTASMNIAMHSLSQAIRARKDTHE